MNNDIVFLKTTVFRSNGERTVEWSVKIGSSDFEPVDARKLKAMRKLIDEVLNESQKGGAR